MPIELQPYAYDNIPLPIGFAKTISQPFVVALMTDLLDKANDSVLERSWLSRRHPRAAGPQGYTPLKYSKSLAPTAITVGQSTPALTR
ncbi:hypothetical protein [Bradyrhizobium sp. STM 3562]|uniref:hypothetical protein n=1 Tax=Bradyrhizobium sp. STM 3562 TaxID=578924 RepID=UPI003890D03B